MRRTSGRTTRGVLAGLAALGVVAALPGTATADPADLPGYRTADGAERREGAESSSDGPRLREGGTYTATIGPGDTRYWTVKLDGSSSAWISAVAHPEPGTEVAYGEGLTLTLVDTDGTPCGDATTEFRTDGAARPIAAAAGRIVRPDGNCHRAGVYNFRVQRDPGSAGGTTDSPEWPLELRFMSEPGLKGRSSTTPPDTGDSTDPPEVPTGEGRDIRGGTGFNDAAGMAEGVWKDRLRPGETRFYRVPVGWGQQLSVNAEFGTVSAGDQQDYLANGVRVDLHNPARGALDGEAETYEAGDPSAIPLLVRPARYAHRFSYDDAVAGAAFSGWYYVSVHAHAGLEKFVRGTVPVTLRTTLVGKEQPGPEYDGDAAEAGFGVTEDDREQARRGLSPQAADRSGTLRVVAYAGIGAGTLLIVGLGVWTLLARRGGAGAPSAPGAGGTGAPLASPRPSLPGQGGGGAAAPYGTPGAYGRPGSGGPATPPGDWRRG